jgi:hypothetical protein
MLNIEVGGVTFTTVMLHCASPVINSVESARLSAAPHESHLQEQPASGPFPGSNLVRPPRDDPASADLIDIRLSSK